VADSSKTEKATSRRIQKAREQGQFIQARHLTSALQFLTFVSLVAMFASDWTYSVGSLFSFLIRRSVQAELRSTELIYLSRETLVRSVLPLAAGGLIVVAVTILSQLVVTGFGLSFKKLTQGAQNLNPVQRVKNLFSENLRTTLHAVVLLPLFLYAAYRLLYDHLGLYLSLPFLSLQTGVNAVAGELLSLFWKGVAVFAVFGVWDLFRQRSRYLKNLKMTKQEIRDELKETEGNMETKARLRRMLRSFARKRMLRHVSTATAVIVNPTHYAVALRYEPDSDPAPLVVAKGKNYLALRIRAIAEENGVAIVENKPLAQSLYASVEPGQVIPAHLYRAVAEVLAHVFKLMRGYSALQPRH
jgi:flagellar biosynthesis protein FlhB